MFINYLLNIHDLYTADLIYKCQKLKLACGSLICELKPKFALSKNSVCVKQAYINLIFPENLVKYVLCIMYISKICIIY